LGYENLGSEEVRLGDGDIKVVRVGLGRTLQVSGVEVPLRCLSGTTFWQSTFRTGAFRNSTTMTNPISLEPSNYRILKREKPTTTGTSQTDKSRHEEVERKEKKRRIRGGNNIEKHIQPIPGTKRERQSAASLTFTCRMNGSTQFSLFSSILLLSDSDSDSDFRMNE
jgi:hypothetical protein